MPKKYKKTADSLFLDEIKGSDLDYFLAQGWYRMGPTIFTTHYIYYNATLFSTIWLRTPLESYSYSKSLKKLLRKNKAQLIHEFEPYEYDIELEVLYEKYTSVFKGNLPDSLDSYMMDSLGMEIYLIWSKYTLMIC
jgi:arginine-tRNA-protein transferase